MATVPASRPLLDHLLEQRFAAAMPRLAHLARLRGMPADAIDDIVQQTLLEAWNALDTLRDDARFDAWLDGICRNLCRREQRLLSARSPLPLSPLTASGDASFDPPAEDEAFDPEAVRLLLAKVVADFEHRAPSAVAVLERGFEDAIAVLALPAPYRQRLRTTNGVERLNEEMRRRERVIRIFPTRESVLRLLGAVFMEQDEAWTTGHRYFDLHACWQWRQTGQVDVSSSPQHLPMPRAAASGPSVEESRRRREPEHVHERGVPAVAEGRPS